MILQEDVTSIVQRCEKNELCRSSYGLGRRGSRARRYSLGAFDLKVDNEWVVLHDETDVPYYYNPMSQDMMWERPVGTLFCAVCDHHFTAVYCNETERRLCQACYDASREAASPGRRDDMTWKVLKGGDPRSGQADIKALEDTGLALEAERQKQEEADRVARRHSVRRSSTMTKPSAVARELEKLRAGRSLRGPDKGQADALSSLLEMQEAAPSAEELVDRTQRETKVLMSVVEERARHRASRDAAESLEDSEGKRPMLEYRREMKRPSRIRREQAALLEDGDADDDDDDDGDALTLATSASSNSAPD